MRIALLPLVAFCLFVPQGPQEQTPVSRLKKLQGSWLIVSGQYDGKPMPDDAIQSARLVFIDDTLTIASKERVEEFKVTLPSEKRPTEIDLQTKAKTLLGLYLFDGEGLQIALGEDGGKRPTELSSEKDSKATLLTLKRGEPRAVKDNVLTSKELPVARLEFDKGFSYAGSVNFILYGVAFVEQHFFVDLDKENRIKRLYWVQFEGYLPNNAHSYRYKVNKTVNIGGLDFIADAYARNAKNTGRPNSDSARARAFLASKGYRMVSDEVMSQRLVHLIDDAKRNELMIIYMEDLAGTGLRAADVNAGGKAAAQWPDMSSQLLDRAVKEVKILR